MGKRYFVVKQPHGWFRGMFEERDVITTIDACIDRWHILIAEVSTDILNKAERERVPVVDNTKMGYTMASDGDGIDLGLHRKNHRGTVKHGISHTIKTEIDCGVIEIE